MAPSTSYFSDALAPAVDIDCAIIGAGISGVNAAYRLQQQTPGLTYKIFEQRGALGGTWDFLKYPGLRSDSDLYTFGYPWRPWQSNEPIATADKILAYLKECASWAGVDKHIEFNTGLRGADWSSAEQAWTLKLEQADDSQRTVKARFMILATGYYNYKEPLKAEIPGLDNFRGEVVHTQFWPENFDYSNKHVVVIGSGATAITLIPKMVDTAASVTMLQRSPTFILALPKTDLTASILRPILPTSWTQKILRWKYIFLAMFLFHFCRTFPVFARWVIHTRAKRHLPKGYAIRPNLDPLYDPWTQRMALCPDGDFFTTLENPKASIVTAHIDTVTEDRILLKGGADDKKSIKADIIVTATGLKMLAGGGAQLTVDGKKIDYGSQYMWKGSMLEGVPNVSCIFGYINASWTLGSDATAQLITRLLRTMNKEGLTSVTPTVGETAIQERPLMNLASTYVLRGRKTMPKAGDQYPWLPRSNYVSDLWEAKHGDLMVGLQARTANGEVV